MRVVAPRTAPFTSRDFIPLVSPHSRSLTSNPFGLEGPTLNERANSSRGCLIHGTASVNGPGPRPVRGLVSSNTEQQQTGEREVPFRRILCRHGAWHKRAKPLVLLRQRREVVVEKKKMNQACVWQMHSFVMDPRPQAYDRRVATMWITHIIYMCVAPCCIFFYRPRLAAAGGETNKT